LGLEALLAIAGLPEDGAPALAESEPGDAGSLKFGTGVASVVIERKVPYAQGDMRRLALTQL
jgi:hypothetical protein